MTDRPGLEFSFSGLKTHALNSWHKSDKSMAAKIGIAKAFQDAVIDTLVIKCKRAMQASNCKNLVVAGGVGANFALRNRLKEAMQKIGVEVNFPKLEFCTDNGVMIAYTGCLHLLTGKKDQDLSIKVRARWPIESS